MLIKKEYMNIYLVSGIMVACFAFMAISTWGVSGNINSETSMDLAIDRAVDKCWEKNHLDE